MTPALIREGRLALKQAGLENAEREGFWLAEGEPSDAIYRERLKRRLSGEPLQYILGSAFFDEYEFLVGPGCLIPRPETVGLVELGLAHLPESGSVCEIGTGSGAVAITMALKRPDAAVYASEKSPEAMKWALRNQKKHQPANLQLRDGSFFEPFSGQQFDVVAANLPYIPEKDHAGLQREVRVFEPAEALFVPGDGTALIREAMMQLEKFLRPGGFAAFEMDPAQGPSLLELARRFDFVSRTAIAADCFGMDRFLILERKGKS